MQQAPQGLWVVGAKADNQCSLAVTATGKVYGWAKVERIACSWPDLRRRGAAGADAPAAIPGPEHLLAPMREWVDEAWARKGGEPERVGREPRRAETAQ